MSKKNVLTTAFAALVLLPASGLSHHSTAANFDEGSVIEIEGTISSHRLRNPHIRFVVDVVDESGELVQWTIESNSLSGLRRNNISRDLFDIGNQVRLAGNPSRHSETGLWGTNLMTVSGEEVVLDSGGKPRWSKQASNYGGPNDAMEGDGSRPELGIFRVWSHTRATRMLFPETVVADFDLMSYPLTEAAKAAVHSFDPATQNPTLNCRPKGMPTIMEQPYPMGIVEEGGDVVLYLEEYDVVRTIHMDQEGTPAGTPFGPLGYSTGRWDGNSLIVHTDNVDWGWFDQLGIPLTDDVQIGEQFILSEDGSRLDYRMTVVDDTVFTKPVVLEKFWLYVPGVEVKPFECLAE